ncbi:hypothetical protein PFISCL1PPCAC_22000, partial [Pristionchus fissidentatus]
KKQLILTLICHSISAPFLLSVFKSVSQRGLLYFRIYVPNSTISNLTESLGVWGITKEYSIARTEGLITIKKGNTYMKMHIHCISSPNSCSITGDNVLIEMGFF